MSTAVRPQRTMVAVLELFVLYWGPITTQRRKSQSMLAGLVHELTGCSAALGLVLYRWQRSPSRDLCGSDTS